MILARRTVRNVGSQQVDIKEKTAALAGFVLGAMAMGFLLFSLLAMSQEASAAEFLGSDVSAWVGGEHVNDDQESVMLGVSFEWRQVTLELSHGTRRTHWRTIGEDSWQMNEWQSGTTSSLKWHPTRPAFFRPHLIWRHASDITRGRPFNDKEEPTSDFFGIGFTLEQRGEPIALDFAYGKAMRECDILKCFSGSSTNEARVAIRVRFWE